MHIEIFVRRECHSHYNVRIGLKTVICDKETLRTSYSRGRELRKDKKKWKTMQNKSSINLYCIDFFYCNIKNCKNFYTDLKETVNSNDVTSNVLLSIP